MDEIKTKEEIRKINDLQSKLFEAKKSYITKEEFLNIITTIDFESVKSCEIELITGFIIDGEQFRPLSKKIEID